MRLHFFTSDASGFELLDKLPSKDRVVAVVVPSNRLSSAKVESVRAAASMRGLPCCVHRRGEGLPKGLPLATAAISWLYSQIFDVEELKTYPDHLLNMHGGELPRYRGANVLQWAIINGESHLGITWHGIVNEVDAGPIWSERLIEIPPNANALEMRERMIIAGVKDFPDAWRRFRTGHVLRASNTKDGRVWPSRQPEDGRIEPGWSERRVRDMVRALCLPWPPAFVDTNDGRIAIAGVVDRPLTGTLPYMTVEGVTIHLMCSIAIEDAPHAALDMA